MISPDSSPGMLIQETVECSATDSGKTADGGQTRFIVWPKECKWLCPRAKQSEDPVPADEDDGPDFGGIPLSEFRKTEAVTAKILRRLRMTAFLSLTE